MKTSSNRMTKASMCLAASVVALSSFINVAAAQEIEDEETTLSTITVTATKGATGVDAQDVPTALTAFGTEQLEDLQANALGDLGYSVPNVSLDDVGTFPGYANFSIRGLGINSSVPSIDPTVGVFVDGMYLGVSGGVLFDTFDLEGVEVLRGPQGLLFGRNVTGGAILLNTTTPGDEFEATGRVAVETGLKYIASGSISGPMIEDRLSGKLAVFHSDDEGWFENDFTGEEHGANETTIIRPALNFAPNENLQFILKAEVGEMDGDGTVAQNRDIADLGDFDIRIDEPGFANSEWSSLVSETNWDVPFGNGRITNIAAWRQYEASTLSDIDASPIFGFHAETFTDQDQFSNELRYSGTLGAVDLTVGAYYFTQDIHYIEDRKIAGAAIVLTGGGDQTYETQAVFGSADWRVNEDFIINLGLRYSYEEKEADLADLVPGGCSLATSECNVTFSDKEDWSAVTPKVGLRWTPDDDTLVYGFWTKGFRSGGYNFRNNATTIPGPFDQEEQQSFEIGAKRDFGTTARVNVAAFFNEIDDLQREILFVGENNITFQTIANAADAEIWGFELEALFNVTPDFSLGIQAGYLEDEYTEAFFDLNRDGVVNAQDADLRLPRLAPWTYGATATYDTELSGIGNLRANVAFNHRDRQFYDDVNVGILSAADILSANVALSTLDDRWTLSLYGRNLLDEVTEGTNTIVPIFSPNSTFTTLNKGRVVGAELSFNY
ncbi:MAG: TonB-dependent receptor [Henriciella sp.]|nr:TonB-dependent receptor [Henriciella sp.]